MASQSRHERQLMRQRGAGRNVGTTDFGLDFGNAFQALPRSSHSRSHTPAAQPALRRKTPRTSIRRSREPSHARSRRSTSGSALPASEGAARIVSDVSEDTGQLRSAKRRRTKVYDQSLVTVVEPLEPDNEVNRSGDQGELARSEDVHDEGKENFSPKDATKTAKRRKRKSIGQQSSRKKKRPSSETTTASKPVRATSQVNEERQSADVEDNGEYPDEEDEVDAPDQEHADEGVERRESPELGQPMLEAESASPEATGLPKKKRKKRRSIGQNSQKKRPKKTSTTAGGRASLQAAAESACLDDEEPAETQPRQSAKVGSARRIRSDLAAPAGASSPIPSIERDRTSEDEDYEDEDQSPEPPTPAPQKRTAKGRRSQGEGGTQPKARERHATGSSKTRFPIVAHRLAGFDALPTINELGESELDTDEDRAQEAEQRAIFDRPNPNAADVLGQYCRETVQSTIERLSMGAASNRAERKRKRTALEAVGQELNDRLFEMSAAVENRIQLERRTRKAQRAKSELQTRWLEIRKQRESIALQCDEVRQQNWQREKDREEKWAISEAAHKLELEAARSDPPEEDNLEYLLRAVADNVSDTLGPGGLLDRVRRFNGRLERMAGVMEGRDV